MLRFTANALFFPLALLAGSGHAQVAPIFGSLPPAVERQANRLVGV
ncbi:MAG: hypothetical protein KDI48_10800 [Xanthomonadales bacterium]|nr:hypothetical protein [Xanthomonadales bacterium]